MKLKPTLYIPVFCLSFFCISTGFSGSAGELLEHWHGLYSGLILGGQFGHSYDKTGSFGYNVDNDKWHFHESGFNAGVELGHHFRFGKFVLGHEIELGYINLNGSGAEPDSPGLDTVGKTRSSFYSAFRGRVGINRDPYLIFATGGAIDANYIKQVLDICDIAPCGGDTVDAKKRGFVWGYTLGGGMERMVEKALSVKLEYLYFNLNNQNFWGMTDIGIVYTWSGNTAGHIIRGGLNYHFE